jgi:Ca-activated chloride channel family protein
MEFTWPFALVSLILIPIYLAFYLWSLRRRHRYRLVYSSLQLVRLAGQQSPLRRHLPPALYLAALAAMAVGLARPYASIPDAEATGTVILVVDVSRSMLAVDIAPTRIAAAKTAIQDFTARQPKGIKIGVVAFSGSAWLITPPTTDRNEVKSAVQYLGLGRGTNIGEGLQVALDTLANPAGYEAPVLANPATRGPIQAPANPEESLVVLLSDGASTTGPPPLDIARELGLAGVRVYTVGLGTVAGDSDGDFGGSRRLNDVTLKGIADQTGGRYFTAENASELHEVYNEIATHNELVQKRSELTFLAAAAAMLFSIAGAVLSSIWFARLP